MKTDANRPKLVLIPGGGGEVLEGPITRMNLWTRATPLTVKQLVFFGLAKAFLLAGILYGIYG